MISREARPWPALEKEYTELLVGDYCAHGRPKKGRPVLAYFDNPPRCDMGGRAAPPPGGAITPPALHPATDLQTLRRKSQFHVIYRRDFKLGE